MGLTIEQVMRESPTEWIMRLRKAPKIDFDGTDWREQLREAQERILARAAAKMVAKP